MLADLNRKDLLAYFHKLRHTPAEQSHAAVAINVFLNFCVNSGWIEINPISGVKGIGHVKQRDRILTDKELKTVWNRAEEVGYPFGTIIKICILTGLRRSEVSSLRREWIEDSTITVPGAVTKNKRPHIFPIGSLLKGVLDTIPRDHEMLFAGRSGTGFNGWGNAKKRFDKVIKVEPYTLHDLRRTFASTHAQLGTPIHVVEKLLNHVSGSFSGVAGIYNRYSYHEEMKDACLQYENHIRSLCLGNNQT